MRARASLVAGLGLLAAISACGGSKATTYPAQHPAPIGLSLPARGKAPLVIGVVVTSTSAPGEGASDYGLAEGVQVARLRYAQGGTPIDLEIVDDHGTSQGGKDAVAALVAKHVAGIVYASEGDHLAAALAAAHTAGTCVLLPYATSVPATSVPGASAGVWLTGPADADVAAGVRLLAAQAAAPVVFDVGGVPSSLTAALPSAAVHDLTSADGITKAEVAGITAQDLVVVWAGASDSAAVVQRLQQLAVRGRIVLSPAALSSDFAGALAQAQVAGGASVSGRYLTVGLPTSGQARRSAGFTAALRLAAADPSLMDLGGTSPFGKDAALTADARGHDAVIALARAATAGATATPAATCTNLAHLTVTAAAGLAGPDLSFGQPDAVPAGAVQVLQSDDGGHFPVAGSAFQLGWFAVPQASPSP